jgi:peptidoglycan/xylan/chitin deacetylase (PgdA/CDA1 family)
LKLGRTLAPAVLMLLALLAGPASAGPATGLPLSVRATSVSQDGQQLVWKVRLDMRLSAKILARQHRSLCLLRERPGTGSVAGVLCVQPGPRGSSLRLVYMPVSAHGRGPGRVIAASISRSGTTFTARFLPAQIGAAYRPLRYQVLSTVIASGCAPAPAGKLGCQRLFPVRPRAVSLHTPRAVGCVPSGPSFVTSGPPGRHVVALTFDDGPWPDTPQFLAVLEREHVNATFFQLGIQEGTYGSAVDRRMLADGDIIGDHTWNHANVSGGGPFAAGELSSARAAIVRQSGFTPCLFRAPGGAVSPGLISLARSLGFITIQWDVDPRDWSRPGTGAIYANVTGNAHDGAIIIQHDGGGDRSQTLAALPQEIHTLRSRGYQFVTIPELLGLRVIYK